jgi:hypothetical protein
MNARRTPKHIFNAHPPDQCSQIGIDLRASSQVSRFATPVAAKKRTALQKQMLYSDFVGGSMIGIDFGVRICYASTASPCLCRGKGPSL